MRTLTDVSSKIRQVEVELTAGELAARLGYTGLTATHVGMENGIVRVHMQNVAEGNSYPWGKGVDSWEHETDTESEEVALRFEVDNDPQRA